MTDHPTPYALNDAEVAEHSTAAEASFRTTLQLALERAAQTGEETIEVALTVPTAGSLALSLDELAGRRFDVARREAEDRARQAAGERNAAALDEAREAPVYDDAPDAPPVELDEARKPGQPTTLAHRLASHPAGKPLEPTLALAVMASSAIRTTIRQSVETIHTANPDLVTAVAEVLERDAKDADQRTAIAAEHEAATLRAALRFRDELHALTDSAQRRANIAV